MNNDDIIDPFARGLRSIMESRDLKAAPLSEQAGLGETAIRDIFRKGSSPKVSTALRLCRALGLTIDEVIATGEGKSVEASADGVVDARYTSNPEDLLVPIYAVQASAGGGSVIGDEEIVTSLAFPPAYLSKLTRADPRNLAIIGVKGDSMVPSLHDDDIVLIDSSKRDLSYDGLFVIRDNGDGLLIKRIGRASKKGHIMVISDNRDLYPPIERALEDIEVIGKVLWVGRKV